MKTRIITYMVRTLLGIKKTQSQRFLEDGTRIPVTSVVVGGNKVISVKTPDKHGYRAIQLGCGIKKNASKALIGHVKGAGLTTAPLFLREVRLSDGDSTSLPQLGDTLAAASVFKPGDIIDVVGTSKGKGYAGVVKRHHFKGGPRTHGQSDRERAPGSIGQTTTPGRVYKGKRMSGRMGRRRVTIKNLEVLAVTDSEILIKGLVPGVRNSLIVIRKNGEDSKFVPLHKEVDEVEKVEQVEVQKETEEQKETKGEEGKENAS